MLNSTHDFSIVQQTLDSFEATLKHDRDRSRYSDRVWKFLEKASSFALRFSEIVKFFYLKARNIQSRMDLWYCYFRFAILGDLVR